jgi:tetratricopeptide (TPR) repeat protein
MLIGASVVFVITVGSISFVLFGASPEYRGAFHDEIRALFEAALGFCNLDPNYKNVDDKLAECNAMVSYLQANDLMNSGFYTEAADIFVSLGNFKDSIQLAQTCTNEGTYQEALACINSGDYETAKIKLTALGNFEDSKILLAECERESDTIRPQLC